jgi:HAMP domain-containing protein
MGLVTGLFKDRRRSGYSDSRDPLQRALEASRQQESPAERIARLAKEAEAKRVSDRIDSQIQLDAKSKVSVDFPDTKEPSPAKAKKLLILG